jgi:type I restriction enzyme S subunit
LAWAKVCLLEQDTAINQDLRGIIPIDSQTLSVRFLFSWLKSVAHLIVAEGTGATVQGVKLPFIKSFQVPLPPLAEQLRIVSILEEAFAGITTAKTNVEKNLQNAHALFESHLQAIFTKRGKGWLEKRLGDLATFRNGINFTKSSCGDSVKIVGVKDFQSNYWAPLDNLATIVTDGPLPDTDLLRENDILFVRSNGNMELIGRCLLVGEITERITYSGFTIRARLGGADVTPKYLCHFLKSATARRSMIESGTGTNIKSLNQATLSELVVPFPSIAAQAHIVDQLEALDLETQHLASLYQQKLAAFDRLKKSLLHQAFSGQL